jgi:uncharacterized damage-inducible protein DinB
MPLSTTLSLLFERDLTLLKNELSLYKSEATIWQIDKDVANSAGNLTLHLVGNLNTYIGAEIGKTSYVRDRPLEFSAKNIPRQQLLMMIDDTIVVIENALATMQEADFEQEYPLLVLANKTSTEYFLVHLATHLTYHLGQVNYHRRLLD